MEDQVITSYHRMPGFVHLESLGGSWCDEWSSISAILSYAPPGGWTMESEGNLGWPVDPPYCILRDLYHLLIQNLLKLWEILELRDYFFHEQCEKVKRVLREIFKLKMAMGFLIIFVYAYNQVPCVSWNLRQGSRPRLHEERDPWEVSIRVDEIQF